MRVKIFLLFFLPLLPVLLNACVSIDQLNSDVADLKLEVAGLKKDNQNLRKEMAELSTQIDETQNSLQELRGQIDEQQHLTNKNLAEVKSRLSSLEKLSAALSQTGVTPPTSTAPSPVSGVEATSTTPAVLLDAEEVYNEAYQIYKGGRYPEARSAFAKFLQQFPQDEYADNAQFWIGEAYFKEGKVEEAILAYEEVVKKYPKGNKVPDALLKQGLSFKILGDNDNARILFKRVIEKYPNSPQADVARKELEN